VHGIAIDPPSPQIVHAGMFGGGVAESLDGGATWTAINMGLGNLDVLALASDPAAPGTLYAGTGASVYKFGGGLGCGADLDGDGFGDGCVPCAAPVALTRPRLEIRGLDTPAGDDRLTFTGELTLPYPYDPPLAPIEHGLRMLVEGSRRTLIDVMLPAGAFFGPAGAGWTSTVTMSRYLSGIYKVVIRDRSRTQPGRLRISVKGRRGAYAVTSADLPLRVQLSLTPALVEGPQCGRVLYASAPPAASCAFSASDGTMRCR
jgi:hypothetical protein